MKKQQDPNIIRVRHEFSCDTYIARCRGLQASCTAGPAQAAAAVADKVMKGIPYWLKNVDAHTWMIVN